MVNIQCISITEFNVVNIQCIVITEIKLGKHTMYRYYSYIKVLPSGDRGLTVEDV